MSQITDWIMIGITVIYVIATIVISRANIKSAKASHELLNQSQKQYEETKRLSYMPFLQFIDTDGEGFSNITYLPLCEENEDTYQIRFNGRLKNIGNGTAVNLVYTWDCKSIGIRETEEVPFNAIQAGDSVLWQLAFNCKTGIVDSLHPILLLSFDDILGNTYEQKIHFMFDEDNDDLEYVRCYNDNPVYKGVIAYRLAQ